MKKVFRIKDKFVIILIFIGTVYVFLNSHAQEVEKTFKYENQGQEIEIGFTLNFESIWNNQGSGANDEIAVWRPKPKEGFYNIGDILVVGDDDYPDPNSKRAAFVVKDLGGAALADPDDFIEIWTDKGSGGNTDGSIWEPVCPAGYVSLGHVVNNSYDKPSSDVVKCVQNALVARGLPPKEAAADDRASEGNTDGSFWLVQPGSPESNLAKLKSDTFLVNNKYDESPAGTKFYTLVLGIPEIPTIAITARPPELTRAVAFPEEPTGLCESTQIELPWFAVKDGETSDATRIADDETYLLTQTDCYYPVGFQDNPGSLPAELKLKFTKGFTETETTTISNTLTASFTAQVGGDNTGGFASFTLANSFTAGWSTSQTKSQSRETTHTIPIEPRTAVQAFSVISTYKIEAEKSGRTILKVDGLFGDASNVVPKIYKHSE